MESIWKETVHLDAVLVFSWRDWKIIKKLPQYAVFPRDLTAACLEFCV
jgi:hypothetical protein